MLIMSRWRGVIPPAIIQTAGSGKVSAHALQSTSTGQLAHKARATAMWPRWRTV